MMPGWILLIPFISAAAGWLLARAAGLLLFRPYQPKTIFGLRLQGLIPAQLPKLGREAGQWVEHEFLSSAQLSEKLAAPGAFQKIRPEVEHHIDQFLRVNLGRKMPVISMFIGEKTIGQLKAIFMEELEQLFPAIMQQYAGGLVEELNPAEQVAEKITSVRPAAIEAAARRYAPEFFRAAGYTGAAIGFVCGWLQIFIWLILR